MKFPLQKLFVILFLVSFTASSQYKVRLQGVAGIPTSHLSEYAEVGLGGIIDFSTSVFYSNIELCISAGYLEFGYKTSLQDFRFRFTSYPVMAGVRYNFTAINFIPYIGIQGAILFRRFFVDFKHGFFGEIRTDTYEKAWGFSPETGFRLNINEYLDIDLTLKYNYIISKYIARSHLGVQSGISYRF